MKAKSILVGIGVGLLFVIFAGLVFLPAILSSDMLKPRILKAVNQHILGQLQVEEWSFKWFSGIGARGITYDNRQESLLIKVGEFKNHRGLVHLIANLNNLGAMEIIKPAVYFYLTDKTPSQAPTETEPSAKTGLPPIFGTLKITDGSVLTVNSDRSEKVVIKDLDLFVDISDLKKPVTYRLFMTSGDSRGRFSGEGTLLLSADDPLNLNAIQSDAKVNIESWEIEDVLAILASFAEYPVGSGRLNTDFSLKGSSADSLDLKGQLSLDELKLWGGPLGSDRPLVKDIHMKLDASIAKSAILLKNLVFKSSLANGSATGTFSNQGQNQMSGKADINLAEVFTQLPHTLSLREDTKLSQGNLLVTAKVESSNAVNAFDGTARIDQLKGISKGQKISWDKPISVKARGEMRPQGIRLDNLSLRSAFINADGQGDPSNMRVTLSADLAAALKELKKFIEIREWDGSGKLLAELQVKETSQQISTASLNMDIFNLALSRNRRAILPKQNVKANLAATVRRGENLASSELRQPALTVKSSMASGKFSAERFKWNAADNLPDADNLIINGSLELQQITTLLRNVDLLPKDTQLMGTSHIQANGAMDGHTLVLNNARVDAKNFSYRAGEKTINENRLTLRTKGKINFKTKSLSFAPIEIDASPGTLNVPEFSVADWSNIQKDMKTRATADLDLAKLTKAYGDFIQLPGKTQVSGKGKFNFDIDFSSPKAQFLKVDGDLSPFQLTSDTLPAISEKQVNLRADLTRSPDGKSLSIKNIELNSTPLSLSASGNLDQGEKSQTLDAKGSINLDLKMLSPFLKKIVGQPITITGKGDNPFTLKMISKGNQWAESLKHTNFSGAIRADSINAFGLGISATEVPLRIADAAANAKLAATANGGQLNLKPTIDLKKEPFNLTFPNDSYILKDVDITDSMAEELMALIHPVFKGSVKAEGQIDLYMKYFNWPLSKENRNDASFAGTLNLKGVRINSTNLLTGLLALVGIGGSTTDFGDLSIDFVARNGRVETSPIQLEISGYPLVLQGSVGFDKTLDYKAKLPITPSLVGNDAYKFLEGVTIDVPIRGTTSKPDIDKGVMQEATSSLVQNALQKSVEKGVQNLFEQILKKK